jgi:hypothetical protein
MRIQMRSYMGLEFMDRHYEHEIDDYRPAKIKVKEMTKVVIDDIYDAIVMGQIKKKDIQEEDEEEEELSE